MGGFNNFDLVYYINLNHRTDRLNHITNEIKKTNIDESKVHRIEAIYEDYGALGCSKSHCLALENFINSPETNQTCVILEDDFEFTQPENIVNDLIDNVFNNDVKDFDVLMLSSNTFRELYTTKFNFVTKIIDAQTTSGYVVSRKFAPILLKNYKEGADLLSVSKIRSQHSIDIYMKQLQPNNKWLCLSPKIGKQMESYSDIEKCVYNYNC
jgi:GR25 family glycosyltransferase involved in LPS biosynthesis